ncbi:MAG TPA: Ig-like domain-containing domain [Flavitalea sp.]|nr:Ig-like domain-containing domain [Flavitalea sp.]
MLKLTRLLPFIATILFTSWLLTMQSSCASIVPPTGGPRDSLPPVLLTVNPADSTLNFKGKKISFGFDEYVQIDEVQKNLIVSPTPKTNPIVTVKLKSINVEIKDTLDVNTTYTLNFGNAISDLNEGNVFRQFTYLFSTGRFIDSLELSGRVVVAETGKADSTLIVLLYNLFDDSAVVKERSRYMAKVDTLGNFHFINLAPGKYRVFALKDEGSRRYFDKSQLFAFMDSTVTSQSERNDLMLYAYSEEKEEEEGDTATQSSGSRSRRRPNAKDKILQTANNLGDGKLDLLSNPEIAVSVDPFRNLDSTRVHLLNEKFEPLNRYRLVMDTSNKKISVVHPWLENTKYNILLDSGFVQDTMGRVVLRPDTLQFITKKKSEYGALKLRFLNLDLKKRPILLFLQNDEIKYTHVFKNNQVNIDLFQVGDFDLRIIYDENRNGRWDPGEFFKKHKQPERVLTVARKLNIKANWDTEVDIQL